MKIRIIISTLVLSILSFKAIAQNFEWVKQIGNSSNDRAFSITTDGIGNVYTVGYFNGTVDFDPGAAVYNLNSNGLEDIFISKLDASGNFIWAKNWGGTSYDYGYDVAIDAIGDIYVSGYFNGTADFDPGSGIYNLAATIPTNICLSKFDASGNFIWAKQLEGATGDSGNSIALDSNGNIYLAGAFTGTADFDPNAGIYNMTSTPSTSLNIFITKLTPLGNFVWAKQLGEYVVSFSQIEVDSYSNIYTTGTIMGTNDFDPGVGTYYLSNSITPYSNFISKLDSFGNFVWAKNFVNGSADGFSIVIDNLGNVYTTGEFQGTVDFDPNSGIFNLTTTGNHDIYISKLDESGNFIWAKQIGSPNEDDGLAITLDQFGNVYTTGLFFETADFDPGAGTYNLTSVGMYDAFISKLDSYGNFVWAKQLGGANNERGTSLTVDTFGSIYTTGYFQGNTDFNIENGSFIITSNGVTDVFIHKLSQCMNTSSVDTQIACNSYTWIDGITYTSNNNSATYIIAGGASNGCDSLVNLNLTIKNVTDVSTTLFGETITSNNTNSAYQWLDCNDNYSAISGATNQSYTPIFNGSFAVEISENGCVDTSSCVTITTISIAPNTVQEFVTIYPNPTIDIISIQVGNTDIGQNYMLMDANGKIVKSGKILSSLTSLSLYDLSEGTYTILFGSDQKKSFKVIKE